jgi:hypothetical protein
MSDHRLLIREDVNAMWDGLMNKRGTPEFYKALSEPGNFEWLELLINTAFDRIEKKPKPQSSIRG